MPEPATLGMFLAVSAAAAALWGVTLRYVDERSQSFRRLVFFVMGFTRRPTGGVRSILLSVVYYGVGLLAALLFTAASGLDVPFAFSLTAAQAGLLVLGAVGEISLSNILVDLGCRVTGRGGQKQFAELKEIPWIKGLRELPARAAPVFAAMGAAVEELFFRGVLLRILTDKFLVAPLLAVAIAGALFCLQQLLQVRTAFQALVIGCGCVAISLVGGLLVVLTGSVVPAILCHASFVLFFMTDAAESPRA